MAILQLSPDYLPAAIEGAQAFALRVPYAYLKRIKPGDINDPLLRQIWPFHAENQAPPAGYVLDPLGENQSNTTPGIVHKYQGRVLLITNGSCAIHCRYCFRRHFPYQANALSRQQWANALAYVQKDDSIQEVILSGGDPLTSSDVRLFHLIDAIEAIPHVTRLRIHTRLPIVIPARITDALLDRLSTSRLNIVMVVHANHANEIDDEVGETLKRAIKRRQWQRASLNRFERKTFPVPCPALLFAPARQGGGRTSLWRKWRYCPSISHQDSTETAWFFTAKISAWSGWLRLKNPYKPWFLKALCPNLANLKLFCKNIRLLLANTDLSDYY